MLRLAVGAECSVKSAYLTRHPVGISYGLGAKRRAAGHRSRCRSGCPLCQSQESLASHAYEAARLGGGAHELPARGRRNGAGAQRKLDRKPWLVRSPRSVRLRTADIVMFESGFPFLPPGNTRSLSRIFFICSRMATAAAEERYPVLPARLHRRRRHDPNLLIEIDVIPPGADHLAGAGRGLPEGRDKTSLRPQKRSVKA